MPTASNYRKLMRVAGALVALAACPGTGQAQLTGLATDLLGSGGTPAGPASTVSGQASAVTAVVLGSVTSLANTGTLTDPSDPLGTGQATGSIPGLVSAEALHAATMGWSDQVASEASLANLSMTVAGTGITAGAILSRALAVSGAGGTGLSSIEGLVIGGVPVSITGVPNEVISLPGLLSVTVNEQIQSAGGIVVNALRVRTLDGVTDIVIGSARAGI